MAAEAFIIERHLASFAKFVFLVLNLEAGTYLRERVVAVLQLALEGFELVVDASMLLQRRELGEALVAHIAAQYS